VLRTRLNRIAADPAALDRCLAYIEREIRAVLEAQPGSLGISLLEDRERGGAIFGSVWVSSQEMSRSEDTEAPLRGELARQAGGPVTVEDYTLVFSSVREP